MLRAIEVCRARGAGPADVTQHGRLWTLLCRLYLEFGLLNDAEAAARTSVSLLSAGPCTASAARGRLCLAQVLRRSGKAEVRGDGVRLCTRPAAGTVAVGMGRTAKGGRGMPACRKPSPCCRTCSTKYRCRAPTDTSSRSSAPTSRSVARRGPRLRRYSRPWCSMLARHSIERVRCGWRAVVTRAWARLGRVGGWRTTASWCEPVPSP